MKNTLSSVLILTLGMGLLSSCVLRQTSAVPESPKTITVTGSGCVNVKPDLVYLKFIVRTSDWNVTKAVEKNQTNTKNVIDALTANGLASDDIKTFDYSVSQDNSNAFPGQYTVRNYISVTVRNIENASSIIDQAVKQNTGANGLTEFTYGLSDDASYLRQARTLAMQNAQDAASLLAGASGNKIKGVETISEYNSNPKASVENTIFLNKENKEILKPELGTISITSEVTVTYSLED